MTLESTQRHVQQSLISKSQLISSTICIWFLIFVFYEGYRIISLLDGPPDADLYANTWSFQLLVLAMFRFPIWIIGLLVFLAVEIGLLTRISKPTNKANKALQENSNRR